MATQFGKVATTIYMPNDLHYNVKLLALRRRQTLSKFVNERIEKWVAEMIAADAGGDSRKGSEVAGWPRSQP